MDREKLNGKPFLVWHYSSDKDDENSIYPDPDETSSTSAASASTYSGTTPNISLTPSQTKTPPPSTFKQVKWLDSPTLKNPISRSQTPGGRHEDSDTENPTTTKQPTHVVTHHWQRHNFQEEPIPERYPASRHHGNDRAHTRSLPDDHETERHITAKELEMDLEKYEKERRAARRKQRSQSTYLLVPPHEEQNKAASATQRPGSYRRWSDPHRLACQLDKLSESLDLGKYGKLGVCGTEVARTMHACQSLVPRRMNTKDPQNHPRSSHKQR